MNRTEHLLIRFAEECSEVSQRVSKALVFGLDEVQPGQDLTNAQRLLIEYADVLALAEMLQDGGILRANVGAVRAMIEAKKMKVERYLEYSRKCGRLDG